MIGRLIIAGATAGFITFALVMSYFEIIYQPHGMITW